MLSSLPGRPLTLAEVRKLDASVGLRSCCPLVAFDTGEPLADVIAVALATASEHRLLGYEASLDESWRVISTLPEAASAADLDRISDTVIEWATTTYDASEIVVLGRSDTDDPLEEFLPAHRLGKADMPTLEALPGIDAVHPMFCLAESHEIIGFLTIQIDPADPDEFVLANYGFAPDTQQWQRIERAAVGDEPVGEPDDIDIHTWIRDHYEKEDILAIAPEPLDS